MLLDVTPTSLADQRYLATGTIHNEQGVLGASIAQAGIFVPGDEIVDKLSGQHVASTQTTDAERRDDAPEPAICRLAGPTDR